MPESSRYLWVGAFHESAVGHARAGGALVFLRVRRLPAEPLGRQVDRECRCRIDSAYKEQRAAATATRARLGDLRERRLQLHRPALADQAAAVRQRVEGDEVERAVQRRHSALRPGNVRQQRVDDEPAQLLSEALQLFQLQGAGQIGSSS